MRKIPAFPYGRALRPALFLLVISAGAAAAQTAAVLSVVGESGERLLSRRLAPGESWCIAWNHSVAGFEVRDCYVHRNGRMVLERSHQPDFAAGLGHVPGRGIQVSDGEGGYWIEGLDEPVPGNRYLLRVGSTSVDHRIVHDGGVTSLSRLAAGELVTIRLRPVGSAVLRERP